jgi:hypothetical protein
VQPFRVQFKKSYKWAMEASAIEFSWKRNNAIQALIEKPSWGACPGTSRKGKPNKALMVGVHRAVQEIEHFAVCNDDVSITQPNVRTAGVSDKRSNVRTTLRPRYIHSRTSSPVAASSSLPIYILPKVNLNLERALTLTLTLALH